MSHFDRLSLLQSAVLLREIPPFCHIVQMECEYPAISHRRHASGFWERNTKSFTIYRMLSLTANELEWSFKDILATGKCPEPIDSPGMYKRYVHLWINNFLLFSAFIYIQADLRNSSSYRQLHTVEATVPRGGLRDVCAVLRRRRESSRVHLASVQKRTDAVRPPYHHTYLRNHQGKPMPLAGLPFIWNSFSVSLRSVNYTASFKHRLKYHLLRHS